MINPDTIAAQTKVLIASNAKFAGVTPELDTIISSLAVVMATAVNIELQLIKTQHNLHVHGSAAGPTTPPVIPMT